MSVEDDPVLLARRVAFWRAMWPVFWGVLLANVTTVALGYLVLKVWLDTAL